MNKLNLKKDLKTLFAVIFSALLYSINMKIFVESGNLFPGGFAGTSRIISQAVKMFLNYNLPFGVIYFSMNLIATFFVFKYIGKRFAIFSIIQFSLTSFFTTMLPDFPITNDILLISVFGGILGGVAISIALRNDASSGGTDFLAIYASSRYNAPTWNYVMYFNASILILAGLLFGWNQALYSIVYQFCTTQVIQTLHRRYKLNQLLIVTEKPEEVSNEIFKTCRHGITKLDAEGEYSHTKKNMLYMTCNSYQVNDIINSAKRIDPKVFINVSHVERIVGNYYQKPLE